MEDMTFLQKLVAEHPVATSVAIIAFLIFALIAENWEEIKFFVKKRSSKKEKNS